MASNVNSRISSDIELMQMDTCSVCSDHLDCTSEGDVQLLCHHVFHRRCVERWIDEREECPACRARVLLNEVDFPLQHAGEAVRGASCQFKRLSETGRVHLFYAAFNGDTSFIDDLSRNGVIIRQDERGQAFVYAARGGRVNSLDRLQNGTVSEEDWNLAVVRVSASGYLNGLEYLLNRRPVSQEVRGQAVKAAIAHDHLGIINCLLQNGAISVNDRAIAICDADRLGYQDIVARLWPVDISINTRDQFFIIFARIAAETNQSDLYNRILRSGPISEDARGQVVAFASEYGRLNIVQEVLMTGLISDFWIEEALEWAWNNHRQDIVDVLQPINMEALPIINFQAPQQPHRSEGRALAMAGIGLAIAYLAGRMIGFFR